ncbi:hypothetical protein [Magnetofaba australis]|uniref:hypothetical protein n=1 Tax=Magnetofaba australis TaxID=1472297 RepID=UPI0011804161|nr:hypothetical protein [Magnetofaba australis]
MALLSGCATTIAVSPVDLASAPKVTLDVKLPGHAIVQMSQSAQSLIFDGPPVTFEGSATTLQAPIGEITRRATLQVFQSLFEGGASMGESAVSAAPGELVVTPEIITMEWGYQPLGVRIRPLLRVLVGGALDIFSLQMSNSLLRRLYDARKQEILNQRK